ncbi:MAG: hypothetical protein H6566_21115 [Lewinellaceae bacterium]|nr:hypothetical protein [Lewinellaceae bacterium]
MDRTAFNTVSRINGNQPLNHDQVIIWAEKSPLASKLDDADLTPEAYSKILTDVLDEMPDVEVSELYNGEVSVLDRNRNASYNDPENVLGLAETTVTSKGIKVTANLYSGEGDSDLNMVTNIQNNLGAHEFIGHGKLGFGDKTRTHHKVYEFQMRHPTWDKTTKKYQRQMMDYYLDYRKRETGQ